MDIKKLADKYFKLYFFFLVFCLPLAFIQRCEDAYYMPKLALFVGGLQFLVITVLGGARKKFRLVDWALVAFVLLYPVGIIHAAEKPAAIIKFVEWASAAGVFLYASHYLGLKDIKKAVLLMIVSVVIVSIYAFMQAFSLDLKGWVTNFSGRAFSSLGNPDFLGGFLVVAIPLTLIANKKLSPYLLIFLCVVLVLSQTRSSLAALLISLIILAVMLPGYFAENKKVLAAGAVICLVLVLFSGTGAAISKRVAESFKPADTAASGRIAMWSAGVKIIKNNFFLGAGAGCIDNIFPLYYEGKEYIETDHLHNDFIEIFAESGAGAFGAFIIFLGLYTAAAGKAAGPLQKAALASLAAMSVQAMFNFPFYVLDSKLYFFAILGMAIPAGSSRTDDPLAEYGAGLLASAAALICILVFMAGGIYLNRGIVNTGDQVMMDNLNRAVDIYPYSKKYYYIAEADLNRGELKGAGYYSGLYMRSMPYSKIGAIQAGIIAAETGNLEASTGYFTSFLKRYPDDIDMLNDYGKALFFKGDAAGAIGIYENVIGLDPKNEVAHKNIYGIFLNKGMKDRAEAETARWEKLQAK